MENGAERAQQLDRHARPEAQHLLGGGVGEQHLALGVDDEHCLSHAVEGAAQHGGRQPEFFVRGDQMRGAIGDRGLQRLVGCLAGAERVLEFPARAARGQDQNCGQNQNQYDAGEIDRQQETASGFGPGTLGIKQPALFGHRLRQVSGDRRHRLAVFLADERCDSGAVARIPQPDHLTVDGKLAFRECLGLFDQLLFGGIVLHRIDQCGERQNDRVAGFAILACEFLIAADRKGACGAFGLPQQRAHVGELAENSERTIDGGGVRA
jgi:hypothetical protein